MFETIVWVWTWGHWKLVGIYIGSGYAIRFTQSADNFYDYHTSIGIQSQPFGEELKAFTVLLWTKRVR